MSEKITAKLPEWCPYCGAHSVFRSGSAIFGPYDAYTCNICERTHFTQYEEVKKKEKSSHIYYLRYNDGPFYKASPEEIHIIKTIFAANIKAHSHEYCFCSKDENLYCLEVEVRDNNLFVTPLFIGHKMPIINNSLSLGVYEPMCQSKYPLTEIFDHLPKVKGDKKT